MYTLTGYIDIWDKSGKLLGHYDNLTEAQESAKEYMKNNMLHGYKELDIDILGYYSYASIRYIWDSYKGWDIY